MRLKKLFADEEAVSPVIGVILMVAITVILAAVIASVVLGVGQEAGSTSPQAAFSFDYDSDEGNVTIVHESGDSVGVNDTFIRGSGINNNPGNDSSWYNYADGGYGSYSSTIEGDKQAVGAGDRVEFDADDDYEINVVWEDPNGDSTATLSSDSGPNA
ncbi:MAG: type IV pilin [Halobacteriales archaeon SW_9_67_25]|nr:MAG: type IV pilin [Halobacteriales archaeon SW_9_67_25]